MTIIRFTDATSGRHFTADLSALPWTESEEDGLEVQTRSAMLARGTAAGDGGPDFALLAREIIVESGTRQERIVTLSNGVISDLPLTHLEGLITLQVGPATVTATVGPEGDWHVPETDWPGYPGTMWVWRTGTLFPPPPASARGRALAWLLRDTTGIMNATPNGPALAAWVTVQLAEFPEHPQHGAQGSQWSVCHDDHLLMGCQPDYAWSQFIQQSVRDHTRWWLGHRGHHFFWAEDHAAWDAADAGEPHWDGGWHVDPITGHKHTPSDPNPSVGGVPGSNGQASYEDQHMRVDDQGASWPMTGDVLALYAIRARVNASLSCNWIMDPKPMSGGDYRQAAWDWRAAALGGMVDPAQAAIYTAMAGMQLTRSELTADFVMDSEHYWFFGLMMMGAAWLVECPRTDPAIALRAKVQMERAVDFALAHVSVTQYHCTAPSLYIGALLLAARVLGPGQKATRCTELARGMYESPFVPYLHVGDSNYNPAEWGGWLALKTFGVM